MYYFPRDQKFFERPLAEIIDELFFSGKGVPIPDGRHPIITQGSCFASHFSRQLFSVDYPCAHLFINEWINTTFANAIFFSYLNSHNKIFEDSRYTVLESTLRDLFAESLSSSEKDRFVDAIKRSAHFVLTIGVAPLWLHLPTGKYLHGRIEGRLNEFKLETSSVESNTENIESIINSLYNINPSIKIYLTLSPVPLNGSDEYNSIVTADCISKSVLRVSMDNVLRKHAQLSYWPSFEIVRWLSGNVGSFFGGSDGNPRHVNNEVVRAIVSKFLEKNCGIYLLDTAEKEIPEMALEAFKLSINF